MCLKIVKLITHYVGKAAHATEMPVNKSI